MRIIEQLVYKIQGDTSGFDKSMDTSTKKTSAFSKVLAGLSAVAIAAAIKKFGDLVSQTSEYLDNIDKMSQKIGLSREAFQEWDFILSQSGASVNGLQTGVKTLSNAAAEARDGTKEYADEFDKLGVSVTDVNGNMKEQEDLFNEVFIALSNTENQTERTAIANRLLGRSATELSPAFNAGGEAIEDMRQKAHELGLVIDDETVDAGVRLTDNIDQLERAFKSWRTDALQPVISTLANVTDKMLGNESITKELDTITGQLHKTSKEYQGVIKELSGDVSDLSEAERIQLELRKAQLAQQLTDQIAEQVKEYKNLNNQVSDNSQTIQENNDYIKRNQEFFKQQAEELGVSTERLEAETIAYMNSTAEQKNQIATRDALGATAALYSSQLGIMMQKEAENNALIAENNLIEAERKAFISQSAEAIRNGTLSLENYNYLNSELVDQIRDQVKALNEQEQAVEDARDVWGTFAEETDSIDTLNEKIDEWNDYLEENSEFTYANAKAQEVLRILTERKNAILAEEAAAAATLIEAEEKRQEILNNQTASLEQAESLNNALGDSYDLSAEKASIYRSTIEALIASGLDPESETISKLRALYDDLTESQEENTDTTETNLQQHGKYTQDYINAYREMYFNDKDNFIASTNEKAQAFRDAGMEQDEVAKWVSEQIKQYDEDNAESAKTWAEQHKEAIEQVTQGVNGMMSVWSSLNQVQANQNEAQLNRMREEGATEQEIADKKEEFAIEEAKRQKKQATFSAIVNTASAVVESLPNLILAGIAAAAGAAQIAAIQSEPLPQFEVGSIRVPETTQAVVHKDEMILSAPVAEQARNEGLQIAPTGSKGGENTTFMIYLDGKKIAESTVGHINSGRVNKIDARIVK